MELKKKADTITRCIPTSCEGCPHDYNTMAKLREGIRTFIEYFNNERLHQSLEYQTPNEV